MPLCPEDGQIYLTDEERAYVAKVCEKIRKKCTQGFYVDRLHFQLMGIDSFQVINDLYQSFSIIPFKIILCIANTNYFVVIYNYLDMGDTLYNVINKGVFLMEQENILSRDKRFYRVYDVIQGNDHGNALAFFVFLVYYIWIVINLIIVLS